MGKKILLIEDTQSIAELYIRVLQESDFEVIHAIDGESGYDMAIDQKPDLILLDIMLPKKQGLTILRELRIHEDVKHIPIYMLSVLGDQLVKNQAVNLGANGYIVKSQINPFELADRVKEIFETEIQ